MIDTENLRTASLYINNQLLSRGLLRDGQHIDFADPGQTDDDVGATMGQIISVVNDLILRRDRDAEHRDSLSSTMRSLRADNLKCNNDISRLRERLSEVQRKLDIAESAEAALKTQLKSADATVRGLKEDVARTKSLVSQARTSCANEVRRRDRQIDGLKKQLGEAGRARGSRNSSAVTTVHITGEVGREKGSPVRTRPLDDDEYSLRNETNGFLANLAQNLSEENEAILAAMRRSMAQLREMSGWSANEAQDELVVRQPGWEELSAELDSVLEHMKTILTNPSFVPIEEVMTREEEIVRLKDGWFKMETRWKEAVHLIDGWRKRMVASGKPVCEEELEMGLRLSPVRVHDVFETRQARGFELSAVAEEEEDLEMPHPSPCTSNEGSLHLVPADQYNGPGRKGENAELEEEDEDLDNYDEDAPIEEEYDVHEPNVEILQQSAAAAVTDQDESLDSSPLPQPPQLSPLRNCPSAGNRGMLNNPKSRIRPIDFSTIAGGKTKDPALDQDQDALATAESERPPTTKQRDFSTSSLDDVLLSRTEPKASGDAEPKRETSNPSASSKSMEERTTTAQRTPSRPPSRLPLPRNADPAPQQSPLTMATIAAKLAASEREADAARVRAKLKAAREARLAAKKTPAASATAEAGPAKPTSLQQSQDLAEKLAVEGDGSGNAENMDPVKQDPAAAIASSQEGSQLKPEKKRKRDRTANATSKTASRRRSTLSPLELQSLINGNMQREE